MPKYVTEFIGTFFLVLTIALAVTYAGPAAPIAIGVVLIAMVYMGGPVSGAHYNPAVTTGIWLTRKMPTRDVLPYVVAQIGGALAAALLAHLMTGMHPAATPAAARATAALSEVLAKAPDGTVSTVKSLSPTIIDALIVETLFTFALVMVVLNVACTTKCEGNSYYGVAIGLTIMAGAFAGGAISGGAFNPAVGLGLCTVDAINDGGSLRYVWLYVVGPVLGAVIASIVYRMQHPAPSS